MGWGPCTEGETAPSDRVGGAEDRIVDPHVVAQVGDVVAFALAVGVVLHAVERQVVQAHLIVAVAYQHLRDGPRHELGDGGAQDLALGVGVGGERWAPAARGWPARRAGPTWMSDLDVRPGGRPREGGAS